MKIECPVHDWFCPYYHLWTGNCQLTEEEGCDPREDCDAFFELEEEE